MTEQTPGANVEEIQPKKSKRRPKRRAPHVITLTSGKGGVGKTNITANLACQLSKLRRRVMILDADLGLANIDIIFGISPQFNIGHVLAGEKTLSEILIEGPSGIRILPASSGIVDATEISEAQKILLLQQMEDLEPDFDYLLIDTSGGINGNVIYFALAGQTTLVIVTHEPTSLADAYALIKVLSISYHQTNFTIVVNEVSGEPEALEVYRRLSSATDRFLNVALDYAGFIPHDPRVRQAVRAQKPFMELYPSCNAAKGIKEIARNLIAMENEPLKSDLGLLWRNVLMSPAA